MQRQFEILLATRKNILKALEDCSLEQLFQIPKGFNNHILWNSLHVIASQQLLIYGLSQTPFRVDKTLVENFRSKTFPTNEINGDLVSLAKDNLLRTVHQLEADYQEKIFGSYKAINTSYEFPISSVEDAILFNNVHESMHLGQIKMLKTLVNKPIYHE